MQASCLVAAIDVGIANMAHCVLRWPKEPRRHRRRPLQAVRDSLAEAQVVAWKVSALQDGSGHRRPSALQLPTLLELVGSFVALHESDFAACDAIVIEQQPAAKMRNLAVALYVLLRRVAPHAHVVLQAAKHKLSWGAELLSFVPGSEIATYRGRKRTATELTRKLLDEHACLRTAAQGFARCRKKDDLSDAFLHALAYCVVCAPIRSPSRAA
jgi:hypothetical protein